MNNPKFPPWSDDPLSSVLATAQYNERVTTLKLPGAYELLQRVHAVFEQVRTITEHESTPNLLPVRILMARARGAWLAAVSLALRGQTVEAYPLVRAVIENAWYALHIAKDPARPAARAIIWLCRDDDEDAEKRCRNEFTVANVRATHEALDANNAARCRALYDESIEQGAHPNERGALTALRRSEDGQTINFQAVLLTDDWKVIALVLKNATESALSALKVFRLIFWERFALTGLGDDIDKLIGQLNSLFAEYAAVARTNSGS
jgi:hypothetical protein